MSKLIITAAVTGSIGTRKENPYIPFSPEEIANEIIRSYRAGAAIAHIHVRDPKTGSPSLNIDHFREVRDRVRAKCDILLNFTTSGLHVAQDEQFFEKRASHLSLKPEICSHDIASMNFTNKVSYNPPEWGSYLIKKAEEYGVKPEIEIFDSGHFRLAHQLIKQGLLKRPYFFSGLLWRVRRGAGKSGKFPLDDQATSVKRSCMEYIGRRSKPVSHDYTVHFAWRTCPSGL